MSCQYHKTDFITRFIIRVINKSDCASNAILSRNRKFSLNEDLEKRRKVKTGKDRINFSIDRKIYQISFLSFSNFAINAVIVVPAAIDAVFYCFLGKGD
jgi:hypothetical protein